MKAQGLSMSILVVAAIAVMVLLLLGVFFTGGFRKIGTNMMNFVEGSGDADDSAAAVRCGQWCTEKATKPEGEFPDIPTGYCYSEGGCTGTDINCTDYCP